MKSLEDMNHVYTAQEWGYKTSKKFQTENYMDESTYEMSRGTEWNREI